MKYNKEQLKRLKVEAQSWDIRLMTRERGYEWYKLGIALGADYRDGEALVDILNEAIDKLISDNLECYDEAEPRR